MRRSMACALLTLAVLMTACEMRAEVSVNEDGSGTFGFVFGLEPIFARAFPSGTDSPFELFREELKESEAPWTIKDFKEPGLEGVRATLPFRDVAELREYLEDLAENDGTFFGGGDNLGQDIIIEELNGGWAFRGRGVTPAAQTAEKAKESGFDTAEMFEGLPMQKDLDKAFRFEFHVTLPGQALSHNATEVERVGERTRFLWRTGMYDSEALELQAQTEPIDPPSPIVPGALVVLVIGGAIMFLRRPPSHRGGAPVVLEGLPVLAGSMPPAAPATAEQFAPDQMPPPLPATDPQSVTTPEAPVEHAVTSPAASGDQKGSNNGTLGASRPQAVSHEEAMDYIADLP